MGKSDMAVRSSNEQEFVFIWLLAILNVRINLALHGFTNPSIAHWFRTKFNPGEHLSTSQLFIGRWETRGGRGEWICRSSNSQCPSATLAVWRISFMVDQAPGANSVFGHIRRYLPPGSRLLNQSTVNHQRHWSRLVTRWASGFSFRHLITPVLNEYTLFCCLVTSLC